MNKTLKKTLIFLLLLAIIVIAVVIVQLFITNNQNGENDVSPSPAETVTATVSPSPSESATPSESPSPTDAGKVTREETPDGVIYTVTVPGSFLTYSMTIDESVLKQDGLAIGIKFKSEKDESEYIHINFVENATAIRLAPSYLDQYIKYTEFEQAGENYIDSTEISGETVLANDGVTQVEAWLVDTEHGVLAVVISYDISKADVQKAQLYEVLSTLEIQP